MGVTSIVGTMIFACFLICTATLTPCSIDCGTNIVTCLVAGLTTAGAVVATPLTDISPAGISTAGIPVPTGKVIAIVSFLKVYKPAEDPNLKRISHSASSSDLLGFTVTPVVLYP